MEKSNKDKLRTNKSNNDNRPIMDVESEIVGIKEETPKPKINIDNSDELKPLIAVEKLPHFGDLPLPKYETTHSAGMDLRAALAENEFIDLLPGRRALVPTGLKIALPDGYEAQIRPRSGLALKNGVTCLNSPGTIDADYRGEVGIILINHGWETLQIKRGDRVAQMVIAPVTQAAWLDVDKLDSTARGEGGFGSTGVK